MSAPVPDSPSISASGYADGLGRREIGFDRESGTVLERLYVRPELGVFGADIAARVERLQSLADERFARPIAVERDGGRVVVVSEYVAGVRIGDLLEMPDALQDAPTLDLALAFLLEALPALETFHAVTDGPHGAISTGRTVLTSSPKVVLLDGSFGEVIDRVHYSRPRLWREFGLAMPAHTGPVRFTFGSDVAQVALTALMLVLGRAIRDNEYPHALSDLVSEVADVALIRGSEAFASGLQQFLRTALPMSSHSSYESAAEALAEVRRVVALEMGADACSAALTAFIGQIDVGAQPLPAAALLAGPTLEVEGFDDESALDLLAVETGESEEAAPLLGGEEIALEHELALDVDEEPAAFDLSLASASEDASAFAATESTDSLTTYVAEEPAESFLKDTYGEPAVAAAPAASAEDKTVDDPFTYRRNTSYDAPVHEDAPSPPVPDQEHFDEPAPARAAVEQPAVTESYLAPAEEPAAIPTAPMEVEPAAGEEQDETDGEAARTSFFSPRRRRGGKSTSARARKDKLRSAAAAFKESVMSRVTQQAEPPTAPAPARPRAAEPPDPAPSAPPPAKPTPPLIPAHRAAAFETPVPDAAAAPPPRPFSTVVPVAPPVPAPAAPAAVVPPPAPFSTPPPPMPVFNSQPVHLTPPAPPQAPSIQMHGGTASIPLSPSTPALKLKTPISLAQPARRERLEPPPSDLPRYPIAADDGTRQFPWKLAAAAVIIILVGVVAGRAYLPDPKVEQERAAAEAAAIAAAARLPPAKRGPAPVPSGKISIVTQPAGAKVLLDGLAAGQTPLNLDSVPAGRHVITLISESGSVKRTVKVDAGQTVTLNEAIFGGWVAIFAPITFEVAENGRLVGNTEEGRLMLSPGRHELTLTNKALGYSAVHTVNIEPGEVRSLTIEPKGVANFNAVPWAEVWVNDQKIGETPLANWQLPLGVHNVVFKNPQYGERRVTATIRANEPVALSVDFNR